MMCWLNLTYFTPYSESQGQCLSTTLYSCPVFMTLNESSNPLDLGKRRTMHTPDSTVINRNIDRFMSAWSRVQDSSTSSIITSKVAKQVQLLQAHILHGCLSNIEPGGGTNYNEALHQYINTILTLVTSNSSIIYYTSNTQLPYIPSLSWLPTIPALPVNQ